MKKILSKVVLFALLAAVVFSCISCQQEAEKIGVLPQQIKNERYYFQQGFREDWDVTANSSEHMLDESIGLILKASPKDSNGKAEYRIYTQDTKLMLTTVEIVMGKIMDENDSKYFFNNFTVYEDGVKRDDFVQAEEYSKVRYNKMQFYEVSYTFVKDGENWKGVYNMIMKGTRYFLITFEVEESVYDTYHDQYLETIEDWRKLGWETDDTVG